MIENTDKLYEIVEVARQSGKISKGVNEATKMMERGKAKLVIYAKDVNPAEIVMHLSILAKEKNISCYEVPSKSELGTSAGLTVGTSAIAITELGEATKLIAALNKIQEKPAKKEIKEEKKEETKKEVKTEEKKQEKPAKKEIKEEKKEETKKEVKTEEKKQEKSVKKETKEEEKKETKTEVKIEEKKQE